MSEGGRHVLLIYGFLALTYCEYSTFYPCSSGSSMIASDGKGTRTRVGRRLWPQNSPEVGVGG